MGAASLRLFSFLCCLLVTPISQASADDPYDCYNDIGNYTANSTYKTNHNTVLSPVVNSPNTEYSYGFYNPTYGQNTDKVYAIGLCRGDAKPDDCHSCFNESRVILTEFCPNQKGATRWSDHCILRYSNHSIYGILDTGSQKIIYNRKCKRRNLSNTATSGDSRRKYATGNSTDVPFRTIRGLAQCTPDLSQENCSTCLDDVISDLRIFYGKDGGLVYTTTCIIRYEVYNFYGPTIDLPSSSSPPLPSPQLPPATTSSSSSEGKSNTSRTTIAVIVPVVVVLVALIICIPVYLRRRKARTFLKGEEDDDNDDIKLWSHCSSILTPYELLQMASRILIN